MNTDETHADCVACDVDELMDAAGPFWSLPMWPAVWVWRKFNAHTCGEDA